MLLALLISQCVLVVILLGFGVVLLALARQVGVLHERLMPLDTSDKEPAVKPGHALPRMTLQGIGGPPVRIGEPLAPGRRQLLLFVAPDCPICKRVLPSALDLGESGAAELVVVGDGPARELAEFGKTQIRGRAPLTAAAELGLVLQIDRLPYAAVIDERGTLAARGLVNNGAHLEALLRDAA
ncbi:thioredoxin domain-containing protein [Acidomonas methanolica]|uniref:alkyl hydroperoxide reductase n=1 Tax=Acidomonas methanolica TaxID=437 RepID=UPI002119CB84|nr:alkyl hydroperoxide reductase [Acidomonas methanolica]MCQ9155781.1 alkyl hydroperoxide reductase [Acidomonas methanolica]